MRTPDEIRNTAIKRFEDISETKFNRGQREHGGSLDENVTLEDIEDEIIDMWFYTQSLRMKHRAEKGQLRAEVERWKERAQR